MEVSTTELLMKILAKLENIETKVNALSSSQQKQSIEHLPRPTDSNSIAEYIENMRKEAMDKVKSTIPDMPNIQAQLPNVPGMNMVPGAGGMVPKRSRKKEKQKDSNEE